MSFLPISINVKNKKIVIVGGGKVATRKVNSLLQYTSNITVVAPLFTEELESIGQIERIAAAYSKEVLKGAFMVYACTNDVSANKQIYNDAEVLGVLCNRTDDGEESHFHSSAVVETENMVLGINSNDRSLNDIVQLKQELEAYMSEREQLLKEKEQLKGKVFLVGFGPGNPDLLTRKGHQLLRQADVIFYDDLLDAESLASYEGEKIYVGKRRNNHSKEQSEINKVLLEAAQQAQMVVRLKGGDPLIFGRGSEERLYLEENGIEVAIIPGISSAIAAAAYGNIPLTHRGISSSVAFGTAHGKNSFKILEADTSVYYMGARNIRDIAQKYLDNGYPKDYPVGLVHKASLPDQKVVITNISDVATGQVEIESPVISIFGETVNYKEKILGVACGLIAK